MSIAQLDDPSMREALGIETDNPSQLTSPVDIGSVALTDLGGGLLQINNGNTGGGGGVRIGGSPVTGISQLTSTDLIFTQLNTGTSTSVIDWDITNALTTLNKVAVISGSACAISGVASLAGAGAGAAVTNIASLAGAAGCALTNIATINGNPVGTATPNNTATTGAYGFPNIPAYPSSIWYGTVQNRVPNGKKFLLTMCLNFQLQPTAPFVGSDRINVRCGQETGNPPNPANNFAEPNLDLIYPDGTAFGVYPFTVINQVELVSDGAGQWSVILEAIGAAHTYNISGTAGVISITELFS
jgi:hypothetical protein